MPVDFTLPPDVEEVRLRVRKFMDTNVRPEEERLESNGADRGEYVRTIVGLRERAKGEGLWNPHLPPEWDGMGLGATAMAFVSAEAGRTGIGPFVINAQAPDEGNMHTLLHWATPEQKEQYLRPLAEGRARSCFAMTEPEVAATANAAASTASAPRGSPTACAGSATPRSPWKCLWTAASSASPTVRCWPISRVSSG